MMSEEFKYKTNLEIVLEDLFWINRNIAARHLIDRYLEAGVKWSAIPKKELVLHEYYNYRQSKLIGGIIRLTSFERSKVTEEFKNICQEVKELITPAIPNRPVTK